MLTFTFTTRRTLNPFSIIAVCTIVLVRSAPQQRFQHVQFGRKEYLVRLQPELDSIDISRYLKNERLVRLQLECLLSDDRPCDIVGRWAKPRVKAALLGECLACTEIQKGWLNTWLQVLIDKFPEFYRAAVAKYIHSNGIQLSPEEYRRINSTFSEQSWEKAAQVFQTLDIDSIAEDMGKYKENPKESSYSNVMTITQPQNSKGDTQTVAGNSTRKEDNALGGSKGKAVHYMERIKRAERGPFPDSAPASFRSSSSGNSQIPRLPPPAPGTVLTYDGRSISSDDANINLTPSSDGRTPSIRHRPQFAPYRGDLPPPVPDYVPRNLPQLGPQDRNRNPKDYYHSRSDV